MQLNHLLGFSAISFCFMSETDQPKGDHMLHSAMKLVELRSRAMDATCL